jgi:dihydroflavonol-4-reductase
VILLPQKSLLSLLVRNKRKINFFKGATGYIGAHIVEQLLSKGYKVRGTSRSLEESKIDFLKKMDTKGDLLEIGKANLTDEGSFDDIVKNTEFVFHVASPFLLNVKDPKKELLEPAVQGTLTLLNSCLKSETVKRVVLTASTASIVDVSDIKKVYNEDDWNKTSSLTNSPYAYSKTCAEQAAWKFMEEKKPHFDLIVINPCMVLGPAHKKELAESVNIILDALNGKFPAIFDLALNIVDVRDVAKSHILAMEIKELKGRHICMNKGVHLRDIFAMISKNFKDCYVPTTDVNFNLILKADVRSVWNNCRVYVVLYYGSSWFGNSK